MPTLPADGAERFEQGVAQFGGVTNRRQRGLLIALLDKEELLVMKTVDATSQRVSAHPVPIRTHLERHPEAVSQTAADEEHNQLGQGQHLIPTPHSVRPLFPQ